MFLHQTFDVHAQKFSSALMHNQMIAGSIHGSRCSCSFTHSTVGAAAVSHGDQRLCCQQTIATLRKTNWSMTYQPYGGIHSCLRSDWPASTPTRSVEQVSALLQVDSSANNWSRSRHWPTLSVVSGLFESLRHIPSIAHLFEPSQLIRICRQVVDHQQHRVVIALQRLFVGLSAPLSNIQNAHILQA